MPRPTYQRAYAVRGKTYQDRVAVREQQRYGKRDEYYKDLIAKTPPGSIERLGRVLDYVRAVAKDMPTDERDQFAGRIAQLADERNKPHDSQ